MPDMKSRIAVPALLAVALVVAACSGDDTSSPSATTAVAITSATTAPAVTGSTAPPVTDQPATSEVPATAPSPTLAYVAAEDSVLAIFRERDDTTRFVQLVEALGSDQVFQQERGVTVLVPVDSAWEAYGEDAFQALLQDRTALTLLLSEHLTVGVLSADDLVARGSFSNAMARDLPVVRDGDTITIGGAQVLVADLTASNGVVHLIDRVLAPPDDATGG
jgi:uncharacterized surface protein with fasciclin (FAS1) repeats